MIQKQVTSSKNERGRWSRQVATSETAERDKLKHGCKSNNKRIDCFSAPSKKFEEYRNLKNIL